VPVVGLVHAAVAIGFEGHERAHPWPLDVVHATCRHRGRFYAVGPPAGATIMPAPTVSLVVSSMMMKLPV
jgi:hypothetical protein